jgi:hypothetical protein
LDDLSLNIGIHYGLPLGNKPFELDATAILKEYSKDNALLFGQWIGENGYFMEFEQFRQKPEKFTKYYTIEELYNLFLEDQNK